MADDRPRSRKQADDSVDVWLGGWHVRFPAGDERPTWSAAKPPDDVPSEAVEGVRFDRFDDRPGVRHGSWIVLVAKEGCRLLNTAPKKARSRIFHFKSSR